jgi:hypothetical protein
MMFTKNSKRICTKQSKQIFGIILSVFCYLIIHSITGFASSLPPQTVVPNGYSQGASSSISDNRYPDIINPYFSNNEKLAVEGFSSKSMPSTNNIYLGISTAIYSMKDNTITLTAYSPGNFFTSTNTVMLDTTKIRLVNRQTNAIYYLTAASKPTLAESSSSITATQITIKLKGNDINSVAKLVENSNDSILFGCKKGWNGPASSADFYGTSLIITGVPMITSASYDCLTGTLDLSIDNNSSDNADKVLVKNLIIESSIDDYRIKTTSDQPNSNSIHVVLSKVDQAGIESLLAYNGDCCELSAVAGWNGKNSTDLYNISLSVTNYSNPILSLDPSVGNTVTIGSPVKAKSSSKGKLYLIPMAGPYYSESDLINELSTTNDGVKTITGVTVNVTQNSDISQYISIPTQALKLQTDIENYDLVAVSTSGVLSTPSAITIKNVAPPTSSLNVVKGTDFGVKIVGKIPESGKVVCTLASSVPDVNKFQFLYSSDYLGVNCPVDDIGFLIDNPIDNYNDIEKELSLNKYLCIYELDEFNRVVKFKAVKLTSSNTAALSSSAYVNPGNIAHSIKINTDNTTGAAIVISLATTKASTPPGLATTPPTNAIKYVLGEDISKVGTLNIKSGVWVQIYEVDSNGKVIRFYQQQLSSSDIKQ